MTKAKHFLAFLALAALSAAALAVFAVPTPAASAEDGASLHDHAEWTALTAAGGEIGADSSAQSPARYYLSENISLQKNLVVPEGAVVELCLNGCLLSPEKVDSVITVRKDARLTICDCTAGGAESSHKYYENEYGKYIFDCGEEGWQEAYDLAEVKGELSGGVITGGNAFNTNGGAIRSLGGTVRLLSGSVAGNEATDTRNGKGGGVYVEDGAFYMSGGSVCGNVAHDGGGIYADGGTFELSGGEVLGNIAKKFSVYFDGGESGGGIFLNAIDLFSMSGGEIKYNSADQYGGGICFGAGEYVLSGGEIMYNSASRGGGLSINSSSGDVVARVPISYNTAEDNGGGVCVAHGRLSLEAGEISHNSAWSGGGVYNTDGFVVDGGNITDNVANYQGGGIYAASDTASVTIASGEISSNTAKLGGGVSTKGTLFVDGGKICGNSAEDDSDGVLITDNEKFTQLKMTAGEISGNGDGYDIFFDGGRKNITGGYIGSLGGVSNVGGIVSAYFTEEPSTAHLGSRSESMLISDSFGDPDFKEQFPYAVYIIMSVSLKPRSPVYDGSPIAEGYDFYLITYYTFEYQYEYAKEGETQFTAGLPTNAGKYTVRFDLGESYIEKTEDGTQYYPAGIVSMEIEIDKAIPSFAIPSDLTATSGQILSEVPLPTGWSWDEPSLVLQEGEVNATATFLPEDTENYTTCNWSLTITVSAEEEDDPVNPGEDEDDPVNPGEDEDDPVNPGEDEDDPANPGEDEDDPVNPGEDEDDPVNPGGDEGEPETPGDEAQNPSDLSAETQDPEGLSGGAIAGIAVGSSLGALAAAYAVCAILFKKGVIGGAFFAKIFPFIR